MGRNYYEYIGGIKYLVVVINANKCITYGRLVKEMSESFSCSHPVTNMHTVNDDIYDTIYEDNIKVVLENSKVLKRKNEEIHIHLQEKLKEYQDYAKTIGKEFIIEN